MHAACCWLLVLSMGFVVGCWTRRYPPVAFVDRLVEIYPEPRSQDCGLTVLTAPPPRPHKVFAQVRSYGASSKAVKKMQTLIREKACEEGADAVVLLPVEQQEHVTSMSMYPDWVTEKADVGYGGRFQRWVDKHYVIGQRGMAIVFKREVPAETQKTEVR
ncbi:MAG: hypothetical protein ACRERD_28225 [Candidatus Binatia bacterium]